MKTVNTQTSQVQPTILAMNPITHRVYQWVCNGGYVDIDELIDKASNPEYFNNFNDEEDDLENRLRYLIEGASEDWMFQWLDDAGIDATPDCKPIYVDEYFPVTHELDLHDLFVPMAFAMWNDYLNYRVLTKAILIHQGLWE